MVLNTNCFHLDTKESQLTKNMNQYYCIILIFIDNDMFDQTSNDSVFPVGKLQNFCDIKIVIDIDDNEYDKKRNNIIIYNSNDDDDDDDDHEFLLSRRSSVDSICGKCTWKQLKHQLIHPHRGLT